MTQTWAIFVDAYRELNARRLFWITLVLSALVVVVFALLGIDETGMSVAGWHFDWFVNTSLISREVFYKSLFVNLGIGFWLSFIATILALVSTAGMVPDLISSGSVELVLSKPIGRVRLFLTKYVGALLFVTLQVTVFSVASFLVLGLRAGAWEAGLFLAIPIMVVFFSYLYSICAFLGLVTRSTVAALLLTLLVWLAIFSIHFSETVIILHGKLAAEQNSDHALQVLERLETRLKDLEESENSADDESVDKVSEQLAELRARVESDRESLDAVSSTLSNWTIAHNIVFGIKTVLPKTSETIALLERWLVEYAELPEPDPDEDANAALQASLNRNVDHRQVQMDIVQTVRSRSVGWVIGTSLGFESVLLALSCWIFWRRDF